MTDDVKRQIQEAIDTKGAILIFPAERIPGVWVSWDIHEDVLSQGTSPERALEAVREAVSLVNEHKIGA